MCFRFVGKTLIVTERLARLHYLHGFRLTPPEPYTASQTRRQGDFSDFAIRASPHLPRLLRSRKAVPLLIAFYLLSRRVVARYGECCTLQGVMSRNVSVPCSCQGTVDLVSEVLWYLGRCNANVRLGNYYYSRTNAIYYLKSVFQNHIS